MSGSFAGTTPTANPLDQMQNLEKEISKLNSELQVWLLWTNLCHFLVSVLVVTC